MSDGFTESDGSFVLSAYNAWDGAPVGEYVVTVVQRQPYLDERGKPGIDRLPARFASAKTSDLRATVKLGPNDLTLELNP